MNKILTSLGAAVLTATVMAAATPAKANVSCFRVPTPYGGHTTCYVMPDYYVPPPVYQPPSRAYYPAYQPRRQCGWNRWGVWVCSRR